MKQILKLAELNMALTLANRELIEARTEKDEDRLDAAKSKDEVRAALVAAGYDTAVMDFF